MSIGKSELIINSDGSIFHLRLLPEQISDKIILVGDPERVTAIGKYLDSIECEVRNREYHTITGHFHGKLVSIVSHGVGSGNIDIVLTELDALVNIDFATRLPKSNHTTLTLIRVGTSGSLQPFLPVGAYVLSEVSIGLDTILHYYAGSQSVIDESISQAFSKHVNWDIRFGSPYAVHADEELITRFHSLELTDTLPLADPTPVAPIDPPAVHVPTAPNDSPVLHPKCIHRGITATAVGFYGPQGRELRLQLTNPSLNTDISTFRYGDLVVTNYEMESSVVGGLALLLGHKAITICCIIANRFCKDMASNYKTAMEDLFMIVLERI
jgi:uridine phosphorylase